MSAIGRMARSISHDLGHSLTAIYANVKFIECPNKRSNTRADLLLDIQGQHRSRQHPLSDHFKAHHRTHSKGI
jgi:K+-sensing histidine kinase KdpD